MSGIGGEAFVVLAPFVESGKTIIYGRNGVREPADDSAVSEVHHYPASEGSGSVKVSGIFFAFSFVSALQVD